MCAAQMLALTCTVACTPHRRFPSLQRVHLRDRELLPAFREFMSWLVREGLRNDYVMDDKVTGVGAAAAAAADLVLLWPCWLGADCRLHPGWQCSPETCVTACL